MRVCRRIIYACAFAAKQLRRLAQERERKGCSITANVVGRHTQQNKKAKVMYISKREQKRRLAYLRTLSKEQLMQAYYARMEQKASESTLEYGRNIFASCKGRRQPKKARNTICKEQNGTCGTYIATKRFPNSRLTCVCKSRNLY